MIVVLLSNTFDSLLGTFKAEVKERGLILYNERNVFTLSRVDVTLYLRATSITNKVNSLLA